MRDKVPAMKRIVIALLLTLPNVSLLRAQESPSDTLVDTPTQDKRPGLLDGLLESLFGEPKTKTGQTHVADDYSSAPMAFGNDLSDPQQPTEPTRIALQDDFDEAIKLSQLEQRPLLVIAGADWCTWCRKLEKELEQADAEPILTQWIVVKIDVDASPALAEEFEVSALPALRVLSADRRVAAKREGYLPLAELQTWLEEAAPQVDPSITRVLYDSTPPDEEQLAKLIEFLGNRSPSIRQAATQRLMEARAVSAKAVITLLGNGRLSQQLCAIDILRSWGAPVANLDPWEPNSILTRHIDELNAWVESLPAPADSSPEPTAEVPIDPEKIKDTVTRWLLEPESKRRGLLSEVMSYGQAVVPELRARLSSATDISDAQRTQLRELLMLNLASRKTRGQHTTLLTALASPNPDTHRKAAAKILEVAVSDDQALVDELSKDVDPLVRESAVPALQRLELLQQPERLKQLLSDKSPSVRTAVLREMAENPDARSIAILSEHAAQETDEDLLVYTAKTLGELLDEAGVDETLCSLAENASWRVRAAALDAFSKRGEYRYDFSSPVVSPKVFETVLRAADDPDPFVMKRAGQLLPKLMSTANARSVVNFLAKRPESIDGFWNGLAEHEREKVVLPLSNAALRLIDNKDPAQVTSAVLLLTKINPEALQPHLPNLLTSTVTPVRIAALKGTVALMEAVRDGDLEVLATGRESLVEPTARGPWYPIPESFQTLPVPPKLAIVTDDSEPDPIPGDEVPLVLRPGVQASNASPGDSQPKLLSSWLENLHAGDEAPEPIEKIKPLRQLLYETWISCDGATIVQDPTSEQYIEMVWLGLANLACGHKEIGDKLAVPALLAPLNAHPKAELSAAPVAVQILPWLPTELKLAAVKDYQLQWQGELSDDDKALLKALTAFENHELASWLLNSVGSQTLSPSQFASMAEYLARALRGAHDRHATLHLSASQLQGDGPFKAEATHVIGAQSAIDWVYAQHKRELSPDQRALLLSMLHTFDYRLGSQSAVGRVASAKTWDREILVATLIALAAEQHIAADRAVQWLEHPLREVRQLALQRLGTASDYFAPKTWELGLMMTASETIGEIPLFFIATRPIPNEPLEVLMVDPDTDISWPAYMLLIANGEEELDDWKEDELDEEQLLTVAAALAKAQRTDEAALRFYKRVDKGTQYYQKHALVRVLSVLDNAEVKELVESIKKDGPARHVSPF